MDLRGKILRILPSPSGNYEVPECNLFADADEGRPEIYVMGARNPYTIGFDWDTGDLYYGDVGPDAHLNDPARGSKGFDEVNRVTRAGNFGWPFFIGDNYPYRIIDEETGEPGKLQDPLRPINNSARNQGAEILPPAEPALIWYLYSRSKKFHELGQGGRNALTAGAYRRADHPAGAPAWPAYFDGKVIVSDFMRRRFIAITLDEAGRRVKLESLAENADFPTPIDLEFGPEGALYVLQYGTRWWQGNEDAGLSRIVFNGDGNRAPVVSFSLNAPAGPPPLPSAQIRRQPLIPMATRLN